MRAATIFDAVAVHGGRSTAQLLHDGLRACAMDDYQDIYYHVTQAWNARYRAPKPVDGESPLRQLARTMHEISEAMHVAHALYDLGFCAQVEPYTDEERAANDSKLPPGTIEKRREWVDAMLLDWIDYAQSPDGPIDPSLKSHDDMLEDLD